MKTLAEIRKSAWRELIANKTITVYDFAPCHEFPDDYRRGHEVNRRRPITATPFDKLAEAFMKLRDTVAAVSFGGLRDSIIAAAERFKRFTDAMSVEVEPPLCIVCGRPETYADGEWYCRSCERDI